MMYGIDAKKWKMNSNFSPSLMNIEQISRVFQDDRTHETLSIYFLHYSRPNVTPEYLGDDNQAIKDCIRALALPQWIMTLSVAAP